MSTLDSLAPITLSSVVVRCPDPIAANIDDAVAIMNVEKGVYYLIEETGSIIWERIATAIRVSDLCDALVQEFEVDAETCTADVLGFLNDLQARGLARVAN